MSGPRQPRAAPPRDGAEQALDRPWFSPRLAGALAFLLMLGVAEIMTRNDLALHEESLRSEVTAHAGAARARLESTLNASMFLSNAVATLVQARPDYDAATFDRIAAALVDGRPHIRNVALSPGNVVRHVYPRAGNEAVLGVDLSRVPGQEAAIQRMMRDGRPVMDGPVKLVQGGRGIINRSPVFLTDSQGRREYWGAASVVVDAQPVLDQIGLGRLGLVYALREWLPGDTPGRVLEGDAALFERDAVLLKVLLPGGSWQMAVMPVQGWKAAAHGPRGHLHRMVSLLAAGLVGWLAYRVAQGRLRMAAMALEDSLTSLPNRRLFGDRAERLIAARIRSGGGFTLLNLDLDDFKAVNDRHGHGVGDAFLRAVAAALGGALRQDDTLARVGGDEFHALLPDTQTLAAAQAAMKRLRAALDQPLECGGVTLRARLSMGAAVYPDDGTELDTLMSVADARMYEDKRSHEAEVAPSAAVAPHRAEAAR